MNASSFTFITFERIMVANFLEKKEKFSKKFNFIRMRKKTDYGKNLFNISKKDAKITSEVFSRLPL